MRDFSGNTAYIKAEGEQACDSAFKDFLEDDATKLLLSMLPKAEHEDLVRTLLKHTFTRGFNCGAGHVSVTMLKHVMTKGPR